VDFLSEEKSKLGGTRVQVSKSEKPRFVFLAPQIEPAVTEALSPTPDSKKYNRLLFDLQRLRGNAYRESHVLWNSASNTFADGLTPDGRHAQAADRKSWHILLQDNGNRVVGCARYRPVEGGFNELAARDSILARSRTFGSKLRQAVEAHIRKAETDRLKYGEVGGWVLCPGQRCSTAAINIALMTFVLADRLGGGMGITTASTRYHSASILRRLGGERLAGLPPYYEPKYGCIIEILGFDIRSLGDQFARKLDQLRECLAGAEILSRTDLRRKTPAYTDVRFPSYPAPANPVYAVS
jgi:hypothetical protein